MSASDRNCFKWEADMQNCAQVPMPNYEIRAQVPMPNYENPAQLPLPHFNDIFQAPMPNYGNPAQLPLPHFKNPAQIPLPNFKNPAQLHLPHIKDFFQAPRSSYGNFAQAPMPSYQERHNDDSMPSCSRAGSSQNTISDQELTSLSVKGLNKQLKDLGCDRGTVQKMKQRRRTLKNRCYASQSRSRHMEQREELQARNNRLREAIEKTKIENEQIKEELQQQAEYHKGLLDMCYQNNIPVPAEFLNLP